MIPYDLPPETYRWIAHLNTQDAIAETSEANNRQVLSPEATEVVWKFGAFSGRRNVKLIVNDLNGEPVKFTLRGNGVGKVLALAQRADYDEVILVDTDHRSSMIIKPLARRAIVSVNDITVRGSIGSIHARSMDLRDDVLIEGSLRFLRLHDVVAGDHTITIGPPDRQRDRATIVLGEVSELSVDSQMRIKSIKARNWVDANGSDEVHAPRIDGITVTHGGLGAGVRADRIRALRVMNGNLSGAVEVLNAAGARGKALGTVLVRNGALTAPLAARNGGRVGTLRLKQIQAPVDIDGRLGIIRTRENVSNTGPGIEINLGDRGQVRGANGSVRVGEGGGTVYVT